MSVTWNSFPELVISVDTTDCSKNGLDKFWMNQDLIFDYETELTGIVNVVSSEPMERFKPNLTQIFPIVGPPID